MDLTQLFPRSPKIKMSGLVMVPRMIDKARAYNAKTLGEYIFPCPLDKIILEFLNIDHEEIIHLAQKLTDEEIVLWIKERCLNRSEKDKEQINQKILERKPNTQESLNRFNKLRNAVNPTRTDITTWVDLLELDENRMPPQIP
jgi:hypothetical protein